MPPLLDTFGRLHDNLRISVTDRCNIRCFYCMPEHEVRFVPRSEILSFEEIERFARVAATLGVTKLRVTGGEPLVRKDLATLLAMLHRVPGIRDLALTTNGLLLEEQAEALYAAGLRRVNVHLDTLDRERFRQITRRDELGRVLAGIHACRRLGYGPIKINAVAVKGLVEPDIVPLARFGREYGLEIRFIEFMPLDAQGLWDRSKVLLADDIVRMLSAEVAPLEPVPDPDPRAPATQYRYSDGGGQVGFIASVSKPFCLNCNRIRLTADGKLRYCLFAIEETDVKGLLRGGASDEAIAETIRANVRAKWIGHEINTQRFVPPPRPASIVSGATPLFELTHIADSEEEGLGAYELGALHAMLDRTYTANHNWVFAFTTDATAYDELWYGLYFDIDHSEGSGASVDPRGKPIICDPLYLPDFALYAPQTAGYTLTPATALFYEWNGSSWNPS